MTKIYLFLLAFFTLSGCSKDIFRSYDKRILGQWHITGINDGIGGNSDHLPFRSGTFVFMENGTLTYRDAGHEFTGTWDIHRDSYRGEEILHTLRITAVDFNNEIILSEFYDDMLFVSSDHFKTTLNQGFRTYITHFRR